MTTTIFFSSEADWIKFVTAIETPEPPNEELKTLLSTPAPWEENPE